LNPTAPLAYYVSFLILTGSGRCKLLHYSRCYSVWKRIFVIPLTTGSDCDRLNHAAVLQAGMDFRETFVFNCVHHFDIFNIQKWFTTPKGF
jgi:hypothetical protein